MLQIGACGPKPQLQEETMNTKQDMIISNIMAVLAAVVMIVVIACNMGNKSSDSNESTASLVAKGETKASENLNFEASLEKVTEFVVGISMEDEESTEETEVTEKVEEVEQKKVSKYDGKFLANASEYLNVRVKPSTDAEIIGKLYNGNGGTIIKQGKDWSKIKSGKVEGYVLNKYLYIGEEVEKHIDELCVLKAVSKVDSLRMRTSPDASAEVVGTLEKGCEAKVIKKGQRWSIIEVNGQQVYVSKKYLKFEYVTSVGKTIAEEEAEAEAERQRIEAEAEAERQRQEAAAEAERKRQEAYQQAISNSHIVDTIQTAAYNISEEEAYLIACTVSAEAGGDIYEDQLAVANVILTRLQSGIYGGSVSSVVYAAGQFEVTRNGQLQKYINNGPLPVAVQATQAAISGVNNVPGYSNFCARYAANFGAYSEYTIIGAQVFYKR